MKCSYCGHELPDSAEFCDNCGMILGFGDEKKGSKKQADDDEILEYTPNVFMGVDLPEEVPEEAMELPVNSKEETVEITHNIPEYVPVDIEGIEADKIQAFEEAEKALNEAVDSIPVEEAPQIENEFKIDGDFAPPEYTPVPDVVIAAKKPSQSIVGRLGEEELKLQKKEKDKKLKDKKKKMHQTYDIESISLEEVHPESVPDILPLADVDLEKKNTEVKDEATAKKETPVITKVPVEEIVATEEIPVAEEIATAEEACVFETQAVEKAIAQEIPTVEEPEVEEVPVVVEAVSENDIYSGRAIDENQFENEQNEEIETGYIPVNIFDDISPDEEEEYEDITPADDYDEIDTPKKKKGGGKKILIACICLIFIAALAVGASELLKEYLPAVAPGTETSDTAETSDVESTSAEEETSDEESTSKEESTDEEESTSEEDTTDVEETTDEETTDNEGIIGEESTSQEVTSSEKEETTTSNKEETTKPTTTKPTTTTRPSTTYPTTTKPTTTKPTTTKPTTTKPTTTKPTTTKPTTTDPYGINNVTVKKPSGYINSFTGYVTAEGVNLRGGPATSYPRVLFLSKGADVKVLAKENGFYYVYSNRYGVYGWASASYISSSRPEVSTSKVYGGTVSPDVTTAAKVMHTTYSLNIRKGPATSYPSVQIIATGYPVKVTGYKSGVSGWVYVTDLTYGVSGWVSSAYLK